MAIQINTDSLTKPHQFIFEACKILWQHKRGFFAFALLPMVLDVVGNILSDEWFIRFQHNKAVDYYSEVGQYVPNNEGWPKTQASESFYMNLASLMTILNILISLPLLAIAWFQYLLNSNYQVKIKSYFKIDIKTVKFICIFFISSLFILIWPYLLYACMIIPHLILFYTLNFDFLNIAFNFPKFKEILKGMDFFFLFVPLIGTPLAIGFGVFVYSFVHILFVLPSTALGKTLDKNKARENISPYRSTIFISLLLFLVASSIFLIQPYEIISKTLQPSETLTEIKFMVMSIIIYAGVAFKNYIILGIFLTLLSLYYKKCVGDK